MLDAGFVPAVLEGFEGTLDEVVGRVASPELSANPDQCAQSFDRTAASRELIWSADGGAPNRANTGGRRSTTVSRSTTQSRGSGRSVWAECASRASVALH